MSTAYLSIGGGPHRYIAAQVQITETLIVDVDDDGHPVGIESLDGPVNWGALFAIVRKGVFRGDAWPPQDAASGRTDPGEGDGTGGGGSEAQKAVQRSALDAAIEAATIAVHDRQCSPDCRESPTTMSPYRPTAEAAVRAAEPILRQAVAEQIARRIEALPALAELPDQDYENEVKVVSRDAAAEIAREVGRA